MGFSFLYCSVSFMRFVLWFSLFHLAVAHSSTSSSSSSIQPRLCHDDDRSALVQFKQSLYTAEYGCYWNPYKNPKVISWKLEGENSTTDCCSWEGIKCNEETGHVIMLDLSSSCLSNSINSSSTLFRLVHLEWLSLADNYFHGYEIPAEIINLSRLSHLNLSASGFIGQIPPELLELSNLVSLDLSYNEFLYVPGNKVDYLELRVPGLENLVDKLTNLKLLDLAGVHISSPVPQNLANLFSLTYLSLQRCQLQGEFPTKIFQLPNLSVLKLRKNTNLTGYLPDFESSPLTFLDIGRCDFSGAVPSSLGNLTKLSHLDMSFNSFLGELPVSIGNLPSLKELVLKGCNFSGQISSALGNLTQLTYFDLSHSSNKFSGQNSPSLSWIAKNTKLTYLDLSVLDLVGEIPSWLVNLTRLTYLDMSQNQLAGPIPSFLMSSISQLSFLYLQSNNLTRHIPSEIRNLTQLKELYLASNSLQGPIPSTIFELKNLRNLNLEFNNLSGTVELDMFLSQLQSLQVLILSSNNLSVISNTAATTNSHKLMRIELRSCNLTEFPSFLHSQDKLRVLDLSSNKISGQIPRQFFNATDYSLSYLNLSHNFLTGFDKYPILLPHFLATLDLRSNKLEGPLPIPQRGLGHYLVSSNKFFGEISPFICISKHLYALDLSNNNLTGVLPQCLGNFSSDLSILALQSNRFHGTISQTFMSGTNLRLIDLSHNKLGGAIPRSLANCTSLEFLHLGNNQITDTFPSWLGTLPELRVLILKSNRLRGVIKEPATDFEFPKLHIIDLSHNMFIGELPSNYFQHWNGMKVVNNERQLLYLHNELQSFYGSIDFQLLDYDYSLTIRNKGTELLYRKLPYMLTSIILSGNQFVGEIPASIASLRLLNNLNLSHNNLQGHIPSSLANLRALESLDLSNNQLSGQIPQQLVDITFLQVFDVSHNHLAGPIPHGKQFDTFDNSSYDGNSGLCGKPLSKRCENFEPSPKEDEDVESPFVLDWKIVLIGLASGLIVGVVFGQEFYTRKHEWFVKTFGIQVMKRKRARRN